MKGIAAGVSAFARLRKEALDSCDLIKKLLMQNQRESNKGERRFYRGRMAGRHPQIKSSLRF